MSCPDWLPTRTDKTPLEANAPIAAMLTGRTITKVRFCEARDGSHLHLLLDDLSAVTVEGYGYDEWGTWVWKEGMK